MKRYHGTAGGASFVGEFASKGTASQRKEGSGVSFWGGLPFSFFGERVGRAALEFSGSFAALADCWGLNVDW